MIEEICRSKRKLILKRTKNRISDIILNRPQPHAYPQTDKKTGCFKKITILLQLCEDFFAGMLYNRKVLRGNPCQRSMHTAPLAKI